MKKALILGGTGAMGVFLIDILKGKKDWDVYVTSRSVHDDYDNIHYLTGNAREADFINPLLTESFDVIVDFMNYGYDEFMECAEKLVSSAKLYIFLSSSRVYAESAVPLTEYSPRLLEVSQDKDFLATQRYALRKARQEDKLALLPQKNYLIVRPYITYSDNRLQLGIYEKEQWLNRILNNKPIVIRRDILSHTTTLTYGYDVAWCIYKLMQMENPSGERVHIVSEETKKWSEILQIYISVLHEERIFPTVYVSDDISKIEELYEGGYNTKYDRLYDRAFCNEVANKLCGHISYLDMDTGLRRCLHNFLDKWRVLGNHSFLGVDEPYEEIVDWYIKNGNLEQIY